MEPSYGLFKEIMALDGLTNQQWEAARLAARGAFTEEFWSPPEQLENCIPRFINHHLLLHAEGENDGWPIVRALRTIFRSTRTYGDLEADPQEARVIENVDCTSPSFVKGVRSAMRPGSIFRLRRHVVGLICIIFDKWFTSPVPVMKPEERSEFCERLAAFMINKTENGAFMPRCGATILLGLLRSREWREHIATRFWSTFAYCARVGEDLESLRWCLENAIELLKFTRGLSSGEGLKWWYGVLWFYFDKLDPAVKDEVEKIAREMSAGDGVSDLHLYLDLIGQEAARIRQGMEGFANDTTKTGQCMNLRTRSIALERNHRRLDRIIKGR